MVPSSVHLPIENYMRYKPQTSSSQNFLARHQELQEQTLLPLSFLSPTWSCLSNIYISTWLKLRGSTWYSIGGVDYLDLLTLFLYFTQFLQLQIHTSMVPYFPNPSCCIGALLSLFSLSSHLQAYNDFLSITHPLRPVSFILEFTRQELERLGLSLVTNKFPGT